MPSLIRLDKDQHEVDEPGVSDDDDDREDEGRVADARRGRVRHTERHAGEKMPKKKVQGYISC